MKKNVVILLLTLFVINVLVSCAKKNELPSIENKLLSFTLGTMKGIPDGDTIRFVVPSISSTEKEKYTRLKPAEILISEGAIVEPSVNENQDFTKPVTYHVTAEDMRSARKYTVVTKFGSSIPSSESKILSFTLGATKGTPNGDTIRFTFPSSDTSKYTLVKPESIELSNGAKVTPLADVAQNFTKPVAYTVTSEDTKASHKYIVVINFVLTEPKNVTGN